jgi:hypothetical protein
MKNLEPKLERIRRCRRWHQIPDTEVEQNSSIDYRPDRLVDQETNVSSRRAQKTSGVQAGDGTMRTHIGHWLEYDWVTIAILLFGMGTLELLVLSM